MLQSKLLPKTRKEAPKDEVSLNAPVAYPRRLHRQADGGRLYHFAFGGLRVMKKIESIIRSEMEAAGGLRELLMPALRSRKKIGKNRQMGDIGSAFPVHQPLFQIRTSPSGLQHEEVISPLVKKFNFVPYRDPPVYLFQFQTKFRDE